MGFNDIYYWGSWEELFGKSEDYYVKNPIWRIDKINTYRKAIGIAKKIYDKIEYDSLDEPTNAHFITVNTTPAEMAFGNETDRKLYKELVNITDFVEMSSFKKGKAVEIMFGFHLIENRNYD